MLNSGGSIVDKLNRSIEYLGGDPHPGATINELVDHLGNTIYDAIGKASTDVFHFKGSVADEEHLPTSDQEVGDVYNIIAESSYGGAGTNVAWTGEEWDALGGESSGGGGLVEITYSELKALRDSGQLVPGTQYKITDYICTVANDENAMVESHPYDIIVTADSESVLNENARAALKDGDTYYFNPETQSDANLAAWELKYCLDNDTSRFKWADAENGKGVVYFLRDDRNNECWYDFKQIKFKRFKVTQSPNCYGILNHYISSGLKEDIESYPDWQITASSDPVWFFTFNTDTWYYVADRCDASIVLKTSNYCSNNKIEPFVYYTENEETYETIYALHLPNNVFEKGSCSYNIIRTSSPNWGQSGCGNTFGQGTSNIKFGGVNSFFGDSCNNIEVDSTSNDNICGGYLTNSSMKNSSGNMINGYCDNVQMYKSSRNKIEGTNNLEMYESNDNEIGQSGFGGYNNYRLIFASNLTASDFAANRQYVTYLGKADLSGLSTT